MTLALIDADILLYRSAFSVEYQEYLFEDMWIRRQKDLASFKEWNYDPEERQGDLFEERRTILGNIHDAFLNLDSQIEAIKRHTGCSEFILFLSSPNNFRDDIKYPVKYKGSRPPKPTYIGAVKNYLITKYSDKVKIISPYEADDLIGIWMTRLTDGGNYGGIICSVDKDLKGIPGPYYHLDDQKISVSTPESASRWFWQQMLMGDRVDSIIGIDGVGPAKAAKAINALPYDEGVLSDYVWQRYVEEFGDTALDMFDSNLMLLEIRRTPLDDFPIG